MEQANHSTHKKTQSSKMSTASSSASSSASDYEQYMKQYYIKKGDPSSAGQSFTHTRIPSQEHGVSGGTFCIPTEKLPEFWAKYSKHVVTNRRHEYLTEKQLPNGGAILVDMDFRYGPHIDTRQHTKDDIENIIGLYMEEISKILNIEEGEKKEISVFVFEKPNLNTDDDKYTKDGIHLIIGIHADRVIQHMLRNAIVKKIPDILSHLPLKNSWDDILDDNISRIQNPVGWQLYGSRKPGHEAYELKYQYNFVYVKSENENDIDIDNNNDGDDGCAGSDAGEGASDDGDEEGKKSDYIWEYQPKNVSFFDFVKNFNLLSAQYEGHPNFENRNSIQREYDAIKSNKIRKPAAGKVGGGLLMRRRTAYSTNSIFDIMNREQLTDEIDRLFSSFEPREHYIKETSDYTMCLPEKYYNQYNLWIRVGWAMRNTSDKLFLSWILFSSQSEKFSYDKISEFYDKWQTFSMENEDGLTRRSIVYWAQHDAKERYNEVYKKTIDYYVDITLSNELVNMNGKPETTMVDLTVVLYNMFKNRFVCANFGDNTWYEFENNRWVECDCGITLKQMISNEMYNVYIARIGSAGGNSGASGASGAPGKSGKGNKQSIAAAAAAAAANAASSTDESGKPNQFQHRISDICLKLKNTGTKANIMKEAQELFYDKKFLQNIDTKTHLLCCNNCVIDFKEKRARQGQPDDYITKSTNIDYFPLDAKKHGKIMAEINDFINKLYPEEDMRKYMWEHLASCLIGINYPQTFNIYTGCGSNGKSKLVELMSITLGEYKAVVPISLITSKRASIGGTSSEIAQLVGIRYAVMQEPSKGMRLEEGPMKEITGGDEIQGRALFKNMITFRPQFKLVVCTNTLFDIKANDEGTWRRIRKVDHKAIFCDNPRDDDPDKPYQYLIDKRLDEKFKSWAPVFLAMLVEKAFETGGMVKDTPGVLASSENYRNSQDYINEFVRDKIRKVEGHYVKKTEMYESFKIWYIEHYDRNVPRGNEIYEVFDKKYGKYVTKGWKGISIIYNHDEVEEEN